MSSSQTDRSSTKQLQEREEYAAKMLEAGADRASVVLHMKERFSVSRRTAQRYVNVAAVDVIGDSHGVTPIGCNRRLNAPEINAP